MKTNLFFNPWVGPAYAHGLGSKSKRTAVIGGSFYCDKGPNNKYGMTCPYYRQCTGIRRKDSSEFNNCPFMYGDLLENEPTHEMESGNAIYSVFANEVSNLSSLAISNEDFWNSVVYTNYIQFMLPHEDRKTAGKISQRDALAFEELMNRLYSQGQQPELVIVWGVAGEDLKHKAVDPEILQESEGYFFHREHNGTLVSFVNVIHPAGLRFLSTEDRVYHDMMFTKYLLRALAE